VESTLKRNAEDAEDAEERRGAIVTTSASLGVLRVLCVPF
jgi:hypothetical protein